MPRAGMSVALLFLLAFPGLCSAQDSVREQIKDLYARWAAKKLDATTLVRFWEKAKSNPEPYVAVLRSELRDRENSPLFLFDGGTRLLYLSNTAFDRSIVIKNLERVDLRKLLREIDVGTYMIAVWPLARANEDVTHAAFRILELPGMTVRMRANEVLDQSEALAYMLLPSDRNYWYRPAAERLQTERDPEAQRSLLQMLWLAQEDFADDVIARFAKDPKKPDESRAFAEELLSRQTDFSAADMLEIGASTEDTLRAKARDTLELYYRGGFAALTKATLKVAAKRRMTAK